MAITLDQLQFDPTDPTENQRVGSFLISLGGQVIDSTDVSGTDGLNVNVLNTITVTATDLDIRDLTHVSDSIKIGDGTDFLAVNADGSINVNLTDDSIADDAVDAGNPFKVGGRAYSTATALGALSASGDRGDLLMDLYRQVFVRDSHDVAAVFTEETVGATAAEILATPTAGRKTVLLQNQSNDDIWLGFDNTVAVDNGIKIPKNASMEFKFGASIDLWCISSGAGKVLGCIEAA